MQRKASLYYKNTNSKCHQSNNYYDKKKKGSQYEGFRKGWYVGGGGSGKSPTYLQDYYVTKAIMKIVLVCRLLNGHEILLQHVLIPATQTHTHMPTHIQFCSTD